MNLLEDNWTVSSAESGRTFGGCSWAQGCDEMLHNLGIFALKSWRTRGDLIEIFKSARGDLGTKSEKLFTFIPNRDTKSYSLRLHCKSIQLKMRARFLTSRVLAPLNRPQQHVVNVNDVDGFAEALGAHWAQIWKRKFICICTKDFLTWWCSWCPVFQTQNTRY